MNTKKLTLSALFVAVGTLTGNIFYIPVGVAKCFPVQHAINVLSAIILGPWYALLNAFVISLLRNILGTGSLLAFPGSMIGAFLAGIVYMKTANSRLTLLGEVIGTGLLGAVAAFPIANLLMGKNVAVYAFVIPFMVSTVGGSIIGYIILKALERTKVLNKIA